MTTTSTATEIAAITARIAQLEEAQAIRERIAQIEAAKVTTRRTVRVTVRRPRKARWTW
jgi:hypothetical protein